MISPASNSILSTGGLPGTAVCGIMSQMAYVTMDGVTENTNQSDHLNLRLLF